MYTAFNAEEGLASSANADEKQQTSWAILKVGSYVYMYPVLTD